MNASRNIAAVALVLALVGPFGCAGSQSEAQDEVTSDNEQALQSAWGALPMNPDGSTAQMQSTNDINIGPCRYTGVTFTIDGAHSLTGIRARQLPSPQMCKPAGGNSSVGRFLGLKGYPSTYAEARIVGPGPNGTLAFIGRGSLGPIAAAAGTTPALDIKLVRPVDGAVLRETMLSVCAPAAVGDINVDSGYGFGSSGTLIVSGTKSAPTGLPGDGTCPAVAGAPFITSYKATYTGFGFGTAPVSPPTITID